MSVFLRWGIFGILGVAALIYAYNASKRLAEAHSGRKTPATVTAEIQPANGATPNAQAAPAPEQELDPRCQAELEVARRAIEARRQGDPIDRLLRIQEIAFQEQPRRGRLESVATRWYEAASTNPTPQALSAAVIRDCESVSPAP
jgi:hypothetical protein